MLKFFLLFLILTTQVYGKSIFGVFFLDSFESSVPKLTSQIQREFLGGLDPKEFQSILSKDAMATLARVKERGSQKDYEEAIKEYLATTKADLYFRIKITNEANDEKNLVFTVLNRDKKVIFQRESLYTYEKASEYSRRLSVWVQEFKDILPAVGKIVSIKDGQIKIKIIHQSVVRDFVGRPFHIGSFKYDSDFSQSTYSAMGGVTDQLKDGSFGAYIYNEYTSEKINIGDHLIFLNKESQGVKNQEKFFVSETWFNYLNSPKFSLLDCSLLPIFGNIEKRKELHLTLVNLVAENKLCKFRDDEKVNEILSKYGNNLDEHLSNPQVLKNLAQILRVGALFKLGVYKVINGVSIQFDVISENGKNVYYSKYIVIEQYDEDYISELLLGWILDYKKSLPLNGKVVQIRGSNLLIDIPAGLVEGTKQEFKVVRPVSLRYEEVAGNRKITWKNKTIAYGLIDSINKIHSIGRVFKFENKDAVVKEGDWIIIEDIKFQIKEEGLLYKKHNVKNLRNIGRVKLSTEFSNVTTKSNNEQIFGVGLGLDFFLPYGFLFTGEAVRNLSGGDQSISNNNVNAALGYSFTPRIYEYFTFIDAFIGHRVVNYGIGGLGDRGIGDLKYSGLFGGIRTEVPIYKKFALQGQFDYAPADEVTNSESLFGDAVSSYGFGFKVIGKYNITKSSRIFAEFHQNTYKTTYDVDDTEVTISSQLIKVGYGINF